MMETPRERNDLSLSLCIGILFVCLGPLVPNHYPPWPAFYAEALSLVGLGILCCAYFIRASPVRWPGFGLVVLAIAAVPLLQAAGGLVYFWGDAWLASGYLLLLALSIAVGASLSHDFPVSRLATVVALCVLTTGVVSIGIALTQWLRLDLLGIFATDLPPGNRPFANFGQPNQFATWLVLCVVAAFWLFQSQHLGKASLSVVVIFLLWGLAMTQSRTAWLELALVLILASHFKRKRVFRISQIVLVAMLALATAFSIALPRLNDALLLSASRSLNAMVKSGTRLEHWGSIADAILQRPLLGYGWNQVSVAQAYAGLPYAAREGVIEYSHNLLLDILVWNGIPLGLLLIVSFFFWAFLQLKRCAGSTNAFGVMSVSVLLLHAMLEYPLAYVYFLVPMGLLVGAADRKQWRPAFSHANKVWSAVILLAAFVLFGAIARDYLSVEEDNRALRFEMARIGTQEQRKPAELLLLTQQRDFMRFARTRAVRDMSSTQLDWMKHISERFGYPPVLLRYAMAAGLNGQSAEAEAVMRRLCRVHLPQRCLEGIEAWRTMAHDQFPELGQVRLPISPSPEELRRSLATE